MGSDDDDSCLDHRLAAMEKLFEARLTALHGQIEALRLLKEHDLHSIELRFQESKEALNAALVGSNEAIRRQETSIDNRFTSVNEFRATLADQATHFLTRAEYEAAYQPLVDRIDASNKPNYTVWLSLGTVLALLLSGAFFVIQLKIDVSNAPLSTGLAQVQSTQTDTQRHVGDLQLNVAKNTEALLTQTHDIAANGATNEQQNERIRAIETDLQRMTVMVEEHNTDHATMLDQLKNHQAQLDIGRTSRLADSSEMNQKIVKHDSEIKNLQQWIGVIYERIFSGQKLKPPQP